MPHGRMPVSYTHLDVYKRQVPSSDEMKKAQLQAQEQERIAWENAIPLGGKSCDVYCFDMACLLYTSRCV